MLGNEMDRFGALEFIGEGSFGKVFKTRKKDGEIVALKLITKRGRSSKEISIFRRECEIQQKLKHPNIIHLLDSFETDTELIVVTEFAKGELFKIIEESGSIDEQEVRKIACHLISALYYLHSHRILHRDIKPQNILLGSNGITKLCDFGFARSMGIDTYVLTSIKGTPLYMAPEVIEEKPYDHNADLWSLGCILYELIFRRPPFCANNIVKLIKKITQDVVSYPCSDVLTPDCKDLLEGLLCKDPKRRLSWPELLNHSFIIDEIVIIKDQDCTIPLTCELTASQEIAKETQRKNLTKYQPINPEHPASLKFGALNSPRVFKQDSGLPIPNQTNERLDLTTDASKAQTVTMKKSETLSSSKMTTRLSKDFSQEFPESSIEIEELCKSNTDSNRQSLNQEELTLTSSEVEAKQLENDEWLEFLVKAYREVIDYPDQLEDTAFVAVLLIPLCNVNLSSNVLDYIISILSLPFSGDVEEVNILMIRKTYFDSKIVPVLLNCFKMHFIHDSLSSKCSINEDGGSLVMFEYTFVLLCCLIHQDKSFTQQFVDTIESLGMKNTLSGLVRLKSDTRISENVIAILIQILRTLPEYCINILDIAGISDEEAFEQYMRDLQHATDLMKRRWCLLFINIMKIRITDTAHVNLDLLVDKLEIVRDMIKCGVETKLLDLYQQCLLTLRKVIDMNTE